MTLFKVVPTYCDTLEAVLTFCEVSLLTVRYCGVIKLVGVGAAAAGTPARGAVDKLHKLFCSWSTFFCSFSFWVSANLTTKGDEQPSMVWEWCIALIALIAHCRVENVTKAQPEKKEERERKIKVCPHWEINNIWKLSLMEFLQFCIWMQIKIYPKNECISS